MLPCQKSITKSVTNWNKLQNFRTVGEQFLQIILYLACLMFAYLMKLLWQKEKYICNWFISETHWFVSLCHEYLVRLVKEGITRGSSAPGYSLNSHPGHFHYWLAVTSGDQHYELWHLASYAIYQNFGLYSYLVIHTHINTWTHTHITWAKL